MPEEISAFVIFQAIESESWVRDASNNEVVDETHRLASNQKISVQRGDMVSDSGILDTSFFPEFAASGDLDRFTSFNTAARCAPKSA